jgi:hypothetical protein
VNHKIVSVVVGLILALFLAMSLAFAWAVEVRVPESTQPRSRVLIPHPLRGESADCMKCHASGSMAVPLTHRFFATGSCLSCHDWRPVVLVPHSIAMGDSRCPLCHGDPSQDLGMPEEHLRFTDKNCTFCHKLDGDKWGVQPKPAGLSDMVKPALTHPVSGAFENCLYCHRIGGKPSLPSNHAALAQDTCQWCHTASSTAGDGTP